MGEILLKLSEISLRGGVAVARRSLEAKIPGPNPGPAANQKSEII